MWLNGQHTRPPRAVMMRSVAEVHATAWARPPTKELFLIIPMHMMNRELQGINFGQVRGLDNVLYKL